MDLLGYDYDSLRRELAVELGFPRDPTSWTTAENEDVEDTLKLGLRWFYHPIVLPGERTPHRWTFLRPIDFLETKAGVADYLLPPDFAGMDGNLTWRRDYIWNWTVQEVPEYRIRQMRQVATSTVSTTPSYFAFWPVKVEGATHQRYNLGLYPTPDGAFTLEYRYLAETRALSSENPYALGMPAYADALRAAVMAAAEHKMDSRKGQQWEMYIERMIAGVNQDRRNMQHVSGAGPMVDYSDEYVDWTYRPRVGGGTFNINFQSGSGDSDSGTSPSPPPPEIPADAYTSASGDAYTDADGDYYTYGA